MTGGVFSEFLALMAGFLTLLIPVLAITGFLQTRFPEWVGEEGSPRPVYIGVNMFYSFLFATAGGFVTAWMAGDRALDTALALAIVVLVFGAISALNSKERQPLWYRVVLLAVSPLGAIVGGLLRWKIMETL